MFDELNKYKHNDHFFFMNDDSLGEVCNAPKNRSGVYIIYVLAHGKVDLIYIDSSGKMENNGDIKHQKGGLYDRIVNGKQFDKPRRLSWPKKMKTEDIEALDIYWFDTFNKDVIDIPMYVEGILIQRFFDVHRRLPGWNEVF